MRAIDLLGELGDVACNDLAEVAPKGFTYREDERSGHAEKDCKKENLIFLR